MQPFFSLRLASLAAVLLTGGCAYDYAQGYAPDYPAGYDSGQGGGYQGSGYPGSGYPGSGYDVQPGDRFGGQNVGSIDVFFGPLERYGRWVDSRYGRGFQPSVGRDWRPYVNGRWGQNRLWISDDPWGWATDHYGRWGFDQRVGWVWIPDTTWAPSWTAWREADNVTGWAPIPPGIRYSVNIGFGSGFGYDNWDSWYGPSWVWVPRAYIYQPRFGGRILPWNNGRDYWGGSRWNYNSGWNGRPGYGRPGGWYGHNGDDRDHDREHGRGDWHGRPGDGRPDDNRPRDGGLQGRGRPSVGGAIGGSIAGVPVGGQPAGNWQGRPDDGRWQGRPGADGRPYRGPWRGRENGGVIPGNGGNGQPLGRGPDGNRPEGYRPDGGLGGRLGGAMAPPPPRTALPPMAPAAPPAAAPARERPTPIYAAPPLPPRAEPQERGEPQRRQPQRGEGNREQPQ